MHHAHTYLSPAKINWFLHITGKRVDGYHNLQTVFRLIDLYDTLTFTVTDKAIGSHLPIQLVSDNPVTEQPTDNLIVKAATALLAFAKNNALFTQAQIAQLPLIDIHLDKKIPMGAGLGGGSSNGATTLMMLNTLWQLGLNKKQLCQIGASLGADVPIFIFGQDAIAEGIGEILTPITLPSQQFLLLKPDAHINTAALFQHPNLQRNCTHFDHTRLSQQRQDFCDILSPAFSNVFEPVVEALAPSVATALTYLKSLSTLTGTTPRLTGSGSCVFLPLPLTGSRHVPADMLSTWQHQAPAPSYIVKTLARGSPDRQIF